jgi:hypothetical protein
MKKKILRYASFAMILSLLYCCNDNDKDVPTPIAPILKEVIFPSENSVVPGKDATISGKGFSQEDKVYLQAATGTPVEVVVTEVTDNYITITVPKDAGGSYSVIVERADKQTTLDGVLKVPLIVPLDNVVMPSSNVQQGSTVTINGSGFETGDVIQLTGDFYPAAKVIKISTTAYSDKIIFVLPAGCYGANNVIVCRQDRKTVLGTLNIEVNIGDAIGGGVVFWIDANKVHGLICNKINTGSATEQFGPSVAVASAAGTSKTLGTGKANTQKLLTQIANFRLSSTTWNSKKTAAEMCNELVVTDGSDSYDDWYLPSQEELIEVFKNKAMLATKGASMPANNYWTSSEGDGQDAGWSAYYVNFYESVNIVSGNSDKEGWKIGIRAIRSF